MKLKYKLISITVPMVLVTALSVGLFATSANRKSILQTIYYHLRTVAEGYVESELRHRNRLLQDAGLSGIESFVAQYQAEALEAAASLTLGEDEHFAIVDGEGAIRYISHEEVRRNHGPLLAGVARDLIARKDTGLWEEIVDTHPDREENEIFVALAFHPWNWVVIASSHERRLLETSRGIFRVVAGFSVFFSIVAAGLMLLLYREQLLRPVSTLTRAAEAIAHRDHVERIAIDSGDEFGALARSMEGISGSLREYYRQQQHWQDELEKKVTERTGRISEINEELWTENIERERAEEALKASEERFRSLFLNAPLAYQSLDIDGNFLQVNNAFLTLLGYERREVIGRNFGDFLVEDGKESFSERFPVFKERGVTKDAAFTMRRKDGSSVLVTISGRVARETDGTFRQTHCILTDITEQRAAEEALQSAHRDLERKVRDRTAELSAANRRLLELDELKSMFIASMSHELRTPLNAIIGFTGILLQGLPGIINREQEHQLGLVKNSANHLLDLVNDVIDVSKIEAGKVELEIGTFDVAALAGEVAEAFAIEARQKGVDLSCAAPPEAVVRSDIRRVRQVLMNLVGNAVKYTAEGSVRVAISKSAGTVRISVKDTGEGIRKEDMALLYQPFGRISAESRRKEDGTGLGLHVSRRLAHLLGGDISVVSSFGHGSEFTLIIPSELTVAMRR